MFRKTFVKINSSILTQNICNIKNNYPEYNYYFGVVKGNAYGHGMQIVNALIAGGVNYLAVATLEEAIKVRKFNKEIPVLCLEPISPEYSSIVLENNVTVTIDSLKLLQQWNLLNLNNKVKVHIKIDTGMNRLGIKEQNEVKAVFSEPLQDNLFIEGIYTHLATSGVNDEFYDVQINNWNNLTKSVNLKSIPIVHIGRSLILVHHKKPDFANGIRLGICMYGFAQSLAIPTGLHKIKRDWNLKSKKISSTILSNNLNLNTAFSLYSEVISLKSVKKGEFVGYGASYKANSDITVATVAIGYYDGIDDNIGSVIIKGKSCPIIGELCMDMTFVQVTSDVKVGDMVEIFGDQRSIRQVAQHSSKSAYRVLTGITSRVPRIQDGKEYYI